MQGDFYPSLPQKVQIHIPNAEQWLKKGFDYTVKSFSNGQRTIWNEKNYRPIVDWMSDNDGKGLLITGSCGLGKTLIGTYILPQVINYFCRKVVMCCDANEINTRADELMKYHLLSIDDIGTEERVNLYGNKRMVFPELVDAAEKKGHLLIITTNLNVDELRQKYGDRSISRLRAITKFVPFTGEDLRGKRKDIVKNNIKTRRYVI